MKSSTMRNKWVATCLAIGAAWLVWGIGTAAAAIFNAQMLRGTYAYSVSGGPSSLVLVPPGPGPTPVLGWTVQNGVITLLPNRGSKTEGTVTGQITSTGNGAQGACTGTIDGTYTVNPDGTGTITFNFTSTSPDVCGGQNNVSQPFVAINRNLISLIQTATANNPTTLSGTLALSGTLQRQQ